MNESGRAVGPLMTYFGIYPEELVVIYDDLDLAVGKIRLRQKGSAGGHNGIKSIISHLNTNVFDRIKVGIGRPEGKKTVVQHVLSPFSKENQPLIEESMCQSVKAVEYLIEGHRSWMRWIDSIEEGGKGMDIIQLVGKDPQVKEWVSNLEEKMPRQTNHRISGLSENTSICSSV